MVEKKSPSRILFLIIAFILLTGIAFICIVPLWHTVMASFTDGATLLSYKGLMLLPKGGFTFYGYKVAFGLKEVWLGYLWTIIYVVGSTLLGLVLTLFGGYYLSKKTLLQKPLTMFVMFTMLFNGGLIPTYAVINAIGFNNTPLAIIIPGCTNAIFIMMAVTTFRQIPPSIEEAAQIDGAGHWRIMFQISLPMAKGIMMVVAMNCVVLQWNNWYQASIYLSTARDFWPLQLVIKDLIENRYSIANLTKAPQHLELYSMSFVLSVISTVPILIACPFFQKYFGNMTVGGVKE